VGTALLSAPGASAQEPDPGVTIDPDSPSGREYDIPLESARRGAEPGRDRGAPVRQGQRSAPLFGKGITTKSKASASSKREKASDGAEPAKTAQPRSQAPPVAVRAAASNPGAPAGGLGSTALIVLGGALVLGAGVGAGLLVRRASRS